MNRSVSRNKGLKRLAAGVAFGLAGVVATANVPEASDRSQIMQEIADEKHNREEISYERADQMKAWALGAASSVFKQKGYTGPRQSDTIVVNVDNPNSEVILTLEFDPNSKAEIGSTDPSSLRGFVLEYRSVDASAKPVGFDDSTGITTPIQGVVYDAPDQFSVMLRSENEKNLEGPLTKHYVTDLTKGGFDGTIFEYTDPVYPPKPGQYTPDEVLEIGLREFAEIAKQ